MAKRILVTLGAVLSGLLLAGCTTKTGPVTGPAAGAGDAANPSAVREVTIRVEGMIERQNITWPTWRNRVSEALSGLPGITKVDVDMKKDLLYITYDAEKVTLQQMLDTIQAEEFQGKVVEGTNWVSDASQKRSTPETLLRSVANTDHNAGGKTNAE